MFVWVKVMAVDCCGRGGEAVEVVEAVEASSERRSGGSGGLEETCDTIGKIEVGSWKDIMGGGGGLEDVERAAYMS